MSTSVGISVGTYLAAATLGERFNTTAHRLSEQSNVALIVEKAADFLASIAEDVSEGWNVRVREPQPYIMYPAHTLFSREQVQSLAEKPSTGDGLGDVFLPNLSDEASGNLIQIRKAFNLVSDAAAARLAVGVYSAVQNKLLNQYADAFLSKKEDGDLKTKQLFVSRLSPKA